MLHNTVLGRLGASVLATVTAALTGVFFASAPASANDRTIDKLPFAKHASLTFLGSISFPATSGSLTNRNWLGQASITTNAGCPTGTAASRSKIVLSDGTDTTAGVATIRYDPTTRPGWGLNGQPISLSVPTDNEYALNSGGFVDKVKSPTPADIPAGDFYFVITCDQTLRSGTAAVQSPYFAIKLVSDGTNWTVAQDTPVADQDTTTTFTATETRVDGKVDFAATVAGATSTVTGGTVDFVNVDTSAVLASGTVANGAAVATSTAAVDPVAGVSVKAVYKGTTGFKTSESAAQTVHGVQADTTPKSSQLSLDASSRTVAPPPAGSVKFTAGTGTLTIGQNTSAQITASGQFTGASVADSRKDKSAAWTLNGRASQFTTTATAGTGQANSLPVTALSWTPKAHGTLPDNRATVNGTKAALDTDKPLLSWAAGVAGAGTGTEIVSAADADLALDAQGDYVPGTYTATLTLTLI